MYTTTKELASRWGVSETWVTMLCKQGRIPGVTKNKNRWCIPSNAKKPEDARKTKEKEAIARFRFIDLFAGVGGFHQAMRYLGGECVMAAEINQECVKTYNLNFKTLEKEVRGDVNRIDPATIAPFDVLCAGFPCQPFSKAGQQQGFQDKTRGNLFYKIMDILDGHPEVKFVILENVRNLADKSENWDIITTELIKRGFYITEEPVILSPSDFGIPQIRERVYILGIRKDIRNERILSNGFIHKKDLKLEKHFKQCRMGDAWTILEEEVDDSYIIPEEQERMIFAWDEFRISTGIQVIGFPLWLDSFGVGIENDEDVYKSQGYDSMPKWKQNFLRHNRKFYIEHRAFVDQWIEKYDMLSKIKLYKKFEWNCGTDVTDIRNCLIQIRQSGIRAKRPTYYPSLVAIVNTPIVWVIKFPASGDMKDVGRMEKEYMDCAAECGIAVPETKLMSSRICDGYFAVRRFDRERVGDKLIRHHMLTAAAILEHDWRSPTLDYHTLMKLTRILSRGNQADIIQMYRRMCFNVFAHNRDDHAKNFSWIYDEKQDCWHPSPAYDLTWSTTVFGEHTTMVNGNGRNPGMEDLLEVGRVAGVSKKVCKEIAEEIQEKVSLLEKKYRDMRS